MLGYNENFLEGIVLPMPTFSPQLAGAVLTKPELKNGIFANYVNYTAVTNRERRSPIIVALNIDQELLKKTKRRDRWQIDSRIGSEYQLNNDYYRSNPWDRGHLARRVSAAWGPTKNTAQRASNETFYYSNASLQHANFNQDEWLELENWVLKLALDKDGKITSFSGPIYGDFDRTITPVGRRPAAIPAAFYKVVCFINKATNELDVRAFILLQDSESLADKSGRHMFNNQTYQVTIAEIEERTGLEFQDDIYQKNPLFHDENESAREELNISHFPERIEVDGPDEIIDAETVRPFFANDEINVFIAAAMVNPKGNERENEWISIINLTGDIIDLNGWTLSDTKRNPLNIGDVLNAETCKVYSGQAVVIKPINPLMLANSGGSVLLFNREEQLVDRVKYSSRQAEEQDLPVIFAYRRV